MSDFKAKMHQIRFPLGLRPRPRWGSLQRSSDPRRLRPGLEVRRYTPVSMVYRHFFGRREIIPPLLSGRLPYRYAVHEIWSVDYQENH